MRQARTLIPALLTIFAIVGLALGVIVAIRVQTGIAIAEFTRDPFGFTDIPFYKGALSNIGIMIWSGAAAICYFTWALTRRRLSGTQIPGFMLAGGLLSSILLLDDMFMFHELVFPEYLGVPEEIVYTTYTVAMLGFLGWFRSTILNTDYLLLGFAFAGFAMSIGVDLTASLYTLPGLYIFEDGGKFFGIVNWTAYFVLTGTRFVSGANKDVDTEDLIEATNLNSGPATNEPTSNARRKSAGVAIPTIQDEDLDGNKTIRSARSAPNQ